MITGLPRAAQRLHQGVPQLADLLAHGAQLGKARNPPAAVKGMGKLVDVRSDLAQMPQEPRQLLALDRRAAHRPGLALALANIGYAALAGFVILHLRARGIAGGASVFTAFAVAVFASRLALSRVPDRAGARPTATAAGLLEALGLLIIAVATSLAVALAGAIVVGVGFSMLFPSLALMVVGEVGEDRRGSALGAFTAFFDIGVGLGAPIAGAIASFAGYPAVFVLGAVAALATAALAATTAPQRRA